MLRLFRRTDPLEPSRLELTIGGRTVAVTIKRVARARRFTLRVRTAQRDVVLSMPMRGSLAAARDFAERHAGWILTRIERLEADVAFVPGATIPLRGVPHRITHRPERRGTVSLEPGEPASLLVFGDGAHLRRRLTDWLRRQALLDLTAAVERHCARLGARHGPISVKDTATRWGSCSSDGALSFSWRLILAPPMVLDYLAAHEVAHLREMNHSVRFWRLCAELCPQMEEAKAWLKRHGVELHRYG